MLSRTSPAVTNIPAVANLLQHASRASQCYLLVGSPGITVEENGESTPVQDTIIKRGLEDSGKFSDGYLLEQASWQLERGKLNSGGSFVAKLYGRFSSTKGGGDLIVGVMANESGSSDTAGTGARMCLLAICLDSMDLDSAATTLANHPAALQNLFGQFDDRFKNGTLHVIGFRVSDISDAHVTREREKVRQANLSTGEEFTHEVTRTEIKLGRPHSRTDSYRY